MTDGETKAKEEREKKGDKPEKNVRKKDPRQKGVRERKKRIEV